MRVCIFDTETTGKLDFHAAPDAPHQPRLVELACGIFNSEGTLLSSSSLIVQPEGFDIPPEATKVHGISTNFAHEVGVPLKVVLALFNAQMRAAGLAVAFNWSFDARVLTGEYLRLGKWDELDRPHACAMLKAKDYLKLPGFYGDYKYPRLEEAHRFFFGKNFDDAHGAMSDVMATARVWFEMLRREQAPAAATQ